ncbi:MAG: heavy metal transporter [Ferruginibacter sp.]|nr:heavy metal transporter [Ferruginibacter sp.]
MTHTYTVTGMTCGSCESKVKAGLLSIPAIDTADVSKEQGSATISMKEHVPLQEMQKVLGPKYHISSIQEEEMPEAQSWLATYKPILLIFGYISIISILLAWHAGEFMPMSFMNIFMAGFFLTFSFFKMLDLQGFADSYAMYDILAKRIKGWGYVYPFAELALGIAYATGFQPLATNMATVILMTISIIGVLQSLFRKQTIRCACLGAVFNLPMSTITVIEDALMIAMSAGMIIALA